MVLIISTKQWLMIKDAIMFPRFFEHRYSEEERGEVNKLLNTAWKEQIEKRRYEWNGY